MVDVPILTVAAAEAARAWDMLDKIEEFSLRLSIGMLGKPFSGPRQKHAGPLFSHLVQRGFSMLRVTPRIDLGNAPKDHYFDYPTILAISRTALDQFAAFHYLCGEPITDAEREFRILRMAVHDMARRVRLIESFGIPGTPLEWTETHRLRTQQLEEHPLFQALPEGERRAVKRGFEAPYHPTDCADAIPWNAEQLKAHWALSSDAVHSGPIGFFQHTEEWDENPATLPNRFIQIASSLGLVYQLLRTATTELAEIQPKIFEWIYSGELNPSWRSAPRPALNFRTLTEFQVDLVAFTPPHSDSSVGV